LNGKECVSEGGARDGIAGGVKMGSKGEFVLLSSRANRTIGVAKIVTNFKD
jgi:hypothetical protein